MSSGICIYRKAAGIFLDIQENPGGSLGSIFHCGLKAQWVL